MKKDSNNKELIENLKACGFTYIKAVNPVTLQIKIKGIKFMYNTYKFTFWANPCSSGCQLKYQNFDQILLQY